MRRTTTRTLLLAGLALALIPGLAHGQRTRRRQPTITIHGQVPTPQVVTVRPRAVPQYSRQVLVPNFYDHDFWPSILPGYEVVPRRVVTGAVPGDSGLLADTTVRTDSAMTPGDTAAMRLRADSAARSRTDTGAAGARRDTTGVPPSLSLRAPSGRPLGSRRVRPADLALADRGRPAAGTASAIVHR